MNTLKEDMERLENVFFINGCFSLGDEGKIDTTRFFKDSNELAKLRDKTMDTYDDHSSVYLTGNKYRSFRNFKQVNRSEHGRGAIEFNNISEQVKNCYLQDGNGCFLKTINYIFKEDFSMEHFEFEQSSKGRSDVMTRCRIPGFCERYKIYIGIYDFKSKRILPRSVKQRNVCEYIQKNHYCVLWKKNRRDSLLNGVEEIERKFKYNKKIMNRNNSKQRIR